MANQSVFAKLEQLRRETGARAARGLPDDVIKRFIKSDANLKRAIEEASERFSELAREFPEEIKLDEGRLCERLQADVLNFYPADCVSPYVPLAARGPWIVTTHGGVLYETGGYGMLGLGHAPDGLLAPLQRDYPMANVMTPSFSQYRLTRKLKKMIGGARPCPYERFVFVNSGSEAVCVALRIADLSAKKNTDPGARYAGRKVRAIALKGGFHGRTWRPARVSDSSAKNYQGLASFKDADYLMTVPINDAAALTAAFERAESEGAFVEAVLCEPVMGEGNPGAALDPGFYTLARELSRKHGALLVIDSIQAGLRAQGVLSIVDYPGFEGVEAPDCETYSKAVNAGQYPLSVLALRGEAAQIYRTGVYGNTMTANPRALDIACVVLDQFTPELTENIRQRGAEFKTKLGQLRGEFPDHVVKAEGTGLILALELFKPYSVVGGIGIEQRMRRAGVNVIHGGVNALRFTPWFKITSAEIDLVIEVLREVLNGVIAEEQREKSAGSEDEEESRSYL